MGTQLSKKEIATYSAGIPSSGDRRLDTLSGIQADANERAAAAHALEIMTKLLGLEFDQNLESGRRSGERDVDFVVRSKDGGTFGIDPFMLPKLTGMKGEKMSSIGATRLKNGLNGIRVS